MRSNLSLVRGLTLAVALVLLQAPALAECAPWDGDGPRTLVLALDGIPFRTVERARLEGAFEGWPATSRKSGAGRTSFSFFPVFSPIV